MQDALPKNHGKVPEWLEQLEEALNDRSKVAPRIPRHDAKNFIIWQIIPWLGYDLPFTIVS